MRRFLLLALFLASCNHDRDYPTAVARPTFTINRPRMLVDQSHKNRHSIRGSYKPFASLAANDGYVVEALEDEVTAAALAHHDLFVIPSALGEGDANDQPAFTDAEVAVIERWVADGGSLLLITDHYPFGGAVRNLAARFGVEMHDGMTFDRIHHDRRSGDDSQLEFSRANGLLTSAHPIAKGVDRVVTFTGQSLRAKSGTAILALSDLSQHRAARPRVTRRGRDVVVNVEFGPALPARGWAQALAIEHGRGRVVVYGEAAMASAQKDGDRLIGMNLPATQNRQFVLNTLHWLTPR